MRSLFTRVRSWFHYVLYEKEDEPSDPLIAAILLGLTYIVVPAGFLAWMTFEATGWIHSVPLWLSFSLVAYTIIGAWIATDEWRSRRRSKDGSGHGWIWQLAGQLWPQHRINQVMVMLIVVAHFSGVILRYLDRFAKRDLENASATRLAEAVVIVSVDFWLIILAVALVRSFGPTVSFWQTFKLTAIGLAISNVLVSVEDGPLPWVGFAILLAATLAVPGWLAHLIWRWRADTPRGDPDLLANAPPSWW